MGTKFQLLNFFPSAQQQIIPIQTQSTPILNNYIRVGCYNDTAPFNTNNPQPRAIPYANPLRVTSIEHAKQLATSTNATVFGIQAGGELWYGTAQSDVLPALKYGVVSSNACQSNLGVGWQNDVWVLESLQSLITTPAPITQAPITQAPITQAPITQAPITQALTSSISTITPSTPTITPSVSTSNNKLLLIGGSIFVVVIIIIIVIFIYKHIKSKNRENEDDDNDSDNDT